MTKEYAVQIKKATVKVASFVMVTRDEMLDIMNVFEPNGMCHRALTPLATKSGYWNKGYTIGPYTIRLKYIKPSARSASSVIVPLHGPRPVVPRGRRAFPRTR